MECNGIAPTEVRSPQMRKRTLIYYCKKSRENVSKMPKLRKIVGELQTEVSDMNS